MRTDNSLPGQTGRQDEETLREGPFRTLGLYIHIPFCVRKCRYCDFLSAPSSKEQRACYLESLIHQIQVFGVRLKGRYLVDSIFIGGGTPSLLEANQVNDLLNAVGCAFSLAKDAEITMECNPGTVDEQTLGAFYRAGINRLSIGLQSSDDEELALLGRIHTWEDFLSTFQAARKVGFSNINIDVMGALPGQSVESYEKTLKRVLALGPEHISAYSLIIEEGTPFFEEYGENKAPKTCGGCRQRKELPSEDEVVRMDELTWVLLDQAGFEHYEISNYALPGKQCRHNVKYWHCEEYLGVGTGAASYMRADCGLVSDKTGQSCKNFMRFKMITDTEEFCQTDWLNPTALAASFLECSVLSEKEEMEEMAFLGLRTKEGVRLKDFSERFGRSFFDVYGEVITRYTQMGMMRTDEEHAALTEKGIEVANWIMADFCG